LTRFFKKTAVSAIGVVLAFAGVGSILANNGTEEERFYLPLRMVFESTDPSTDVQWNGETRRITVNQTGQNWEFIVGSNNAYLNGESHQLMYPVIIEDDRASISYFDVSYLFSDPNGEFAGTTMTAVVGAFEFMELASMTGVSIAIVDANSGFTWTQGFGFADSQNNIHVDENTVFGLASIAKPVTAIAVMQLAEEGIIDLDTPLVEYLPDFSINPSQLHGGDYRSITPRMLLTHTAGVFPNFIGYSSITLNGYYEGFMNNLLNRMTSYSMIAPEDTLFIYNNNGYNLLGLLVAEMTGEGEPFRSFVNYTDENIFQVADLESTSFVITDSLMENLARPYVNATTPDTLIFPGGLPTMGLVSSAYDMSQLMHILLNDDGILLPVGRINDMMQPHDFDFSAAMGAARYGLGFFNATGMDGFRTVGHNGALVHYNSDMVFDVNSGLGVFIATNSITGLGTTSQLANIILQTAVMEKTGEVPTLPYRADIEAVPIELSSEELLRYVGLYIGQMEYYLIEMGESGALYMILPTIPDIPPLELTPMSDGSFDSEIGRFWFDQLEDNGEEINVIRQGPLGLHIIASQLDMADVMANEYFMPWVGTFAAQPVTNEVSLISTFRFGVCDIGLAYQQTSQIMGLSPTLPAVVSDNVWSASMEDVTFDDNGNVESFVFAGMRFSR